jgi:hypothetical protein
VKIGNEILECPTVGKITAPIVPQVGKFYVITWLSQKQQVVIPSILVSIGCGISIAFVAAKK